MLKEHTDPVRTRLEANALLTGKVDDVVRVKSAGEGVRENYVVLSVNLPRGIGRRLTGVPAHDGDFTVEVWVRIVAVDRAGVDLLTDAVNKQLQGFRPVVTGRSLTPLNRDDLEPVEHDDTADLYSRDAWYTATTSRA